MGGGGCKSRLCVTHHCLNPNLSLYTLLFIFYFLVIASECIARAWQSIAFFIDCHAKIRSRSFLLAMTAHTKQLFTNSIQSFTHIFSHFKQLPILLTQIFTIFAQFLLINSLQRRFPYERTKVHYHDNRLCR